MNLIIFYEKPGCKTNAKQKQSFREAGCKVIERDLINHGLEREELHEFFKNMPITKWFNPSAPLIKNGKINLSTLDKESALDMLMENPILIRRPLMIIKGRKLCGFNKWFVEKLLDIKMPLKPSMKCETFSKPDEC
ncbi:MAG: arsenate reductase family protein [Campylobacterales bacterium]|nr:arsenate reductase family protein [Campylobacterales bacterium]